MILPIVFFLIKSHRDREGIEIEPETCCRLVLSVLYHHMYLIPLFLSYRFSGIFILGDADWSRLRPSEVSGN